MDITLPRLLVEEKCIGKNRVIQLAEPGGETSVRLLSADKHHIVVEDTLARKLYLYHPRVSSKHPDDQFKLRIRSDTVQQDNISKATELTWIEHPCCCIHPRSPEEIVKSWSQQFHFKKENATYDVAGLREPQIGAIHSIAAHWTVKHDPATIVMPTGIGKTETMLSVLIHCQCPKVLVIVPTDALRTQIYNKFCTLGCLRNINVVPFDLPFPRIALLSKGLRDEDEASSLASEANVIVATATILSSSSDSARARISSLCSHLFIDEAHHLGAPTWEKIKRLFEGKPILQFTATPFRRDGKRLEGDIIYNYPLGRAQDNGYFKTIHFLPIEELDDEQADRNIALAAVQRLQDDLSKKHDHLVLARAKNIDDTARIAGIYTDIAPEFCPVSIHSHLSSSKRSARIERLTKRESRILVCVDMFGEGFDLPNLKIAAMHDVHKSLPITLQFVGRFTRTSKDVGEASVVVNIADTQVDAELAALYAQDANWNMLLRRGSEERIQREISLQELIESFDGNLPNEVPLWNLRPSLSAIVYETKNPTWNPIAFVEALPRREVCWSAASHDRKMVIAVFAKQDDVKWGRYRNIKDWTWHLVLAYWNPEQKLMFLYSSDYNSINCSRLAKALIGDQAKVVNGPRIFRVFNSIERAMVRNLGASKTGTVRYTMYFGPDVTTGLSQVEKAESALTNMFGWGYEDGNKVTRGCSVRKGKLWSVTGGPIMDWQEWCSKMGVKLLDNTIDHNEVVSGFLKPVELSDRPMSVPLAVEWGEMVAREDEDRIKIKMGSNEYSLDRIDLILKDNSDRGPIHFAVSSNDIVSEYELIIGPQPEGNHLYHYTRRSGPSISIKRGSGEYKLLEEWMDRDPIVVLYADGSFSYNNFFVNAACPGKYDAALLSVIDWSDIDIRKESQGPDCQKDSIQYRVIQEFIDEFDIVFNDDASGEAADIIALRKDENDNILLRMVHCKYSSEDKPGARIDDFYNVCGQAQKCISWKHRGLRYLINHMKRREEQWTAQNNTRFVKGNMGKLRVLEKQARHSQLRFEVIIVQPGLSKTQVSDAILNLLGSTDLYLKRTANAHLIVICSS